MIVLGLLGCDGNGNSVGRNARRHGFGEGTMSLFKERFMNAVMSLNNTEGIITWPDADERRQISERFALKGQPGCVGVVDGTYVIFCQRPHIDGEVYWCRKQFYAFNVQLVCDDNKLIRFYQLGFPGSVYDSTVFGRSRIGKQPHRYFSPGEYVMADAGYALCWYICAPYKQPAASIPINKVFNDLYSENRSIIEHVNGSLKSRFCSSRGIRTQVRVIEDVEKVNVHILTCLILNNLMTAFQDDDFAIQEDDIVNENEQDENNEINENGTDLRLRVRNKLLQWGHDNNKY